MRVISRSCITNSYRNYTIIILALAKQNIL